MTTRRFSRGGGWRGGGCGARTALSSPMADKTRVGSPNPLDRVLHGQGVHDRTHHAHVVGGGAVHAGDANMPTRRGRYIAAADDEGGLPPWAWTFSPSSASRCGVAGSMPNWPEPMSASPDSLSRTRRYSGAWLRLALGTWAPLRGRTWTRSAPGSSFTPPSALRLSARRGSLGGTSAAKSVSSSSADLRQGVTGKPAGC